MSFDIGEIQKEIRNKLITNTTLTGLLGDRNDGIVDSPLNMTLVYPYIGFTDIRTEPNDTVSGNSNLYFFTITAFTQTGNRVQAQALLKEMYTTLHQVRLTVSGFTYVMGYVEFSDIITDDVATANGFNGIIRLRIATN